jgi:hypothetical protein
MQVSERPRNEVGGATAAPQARPAVGRYIAGSPALSIVAVLLLTAAGLAFRVAIAGQSVLADELSTYWIISTNGLGGVVSTVHTDAEITPPLFFIAAWLTTQIDLTPELFRLPSLVAGAATVPLVYLLGLRTVGRPAALVAGALAAFSPFLIYYSAEARGYALMTAFVALSTLAMLVALDSRRARWWVVYAASSCAAVYSHYTCVFVLGVQLLWLLWAHPEGRKPALLANVGAAIAFLPWLSGLRADLSSPTTDILSLLNPLEWGYVWDSLSHAAVGYPYAATALTDLPGAPALTLFVLAVLLAVVGLAVGAARGHRSLPARANPRLALVIGLALSVPVGELIVSVVGSNIFAGRNLISALPAFLLCLATLVVSAGPRLRFLTSALAVASFAIGAAKMLDEQYHRPNFQAVADVIDNQADARDAVIDAAVISPGPLSPLDAALERRHRVIRAGVPYQRDRPFWFGDRREPVARATRRAAAAARGGRIFVVTLPTLNRPEFGPLPDPPRPPNRFRLVETRTYQGTEEAKLEVWADGSSPRG